MTRWERAFQKRLRELPREATPSLVVMSQIGDRQRVHIQQGRSYKYYDLASLTKIMFTTQACMHLVESGEFTVSQKINSVLGWWTHESVRVADLLRHFSGLEWWAPVYKHVSRKDPYALRMWQLAALLRASRWRAPKKSVYSDLDFFLLGLVLESVFEKPLIHIWQGLQEEYPYLENLHFNVDNNPLHARGQYAPTEKCPWRKKTLQGEVHDDNCWALGGVGAHAGLFGTAEDVFRWGQALRGSLRGLRNDLRIDPRVVRTFTRRAMPVSQGDWALGFMMPTKGKASCGQYMSAQSIGHTGFTGTSLWYDPKKDWLVVILANRVHPTRDNAIFSKFRPQIHDWLWESYQEVST